MSNPNLHHTKLSGLPWYGGKAGFGKAEWIASLLPWRKTSAYVEPFGGMAAVMLRRAPVIIEIYNDLDSRIVNWWRILRNEPEKFGWVVQCMPISREEYEWAHKSLDDNSLSDFDRALAFHVYALHTTSTNLSSPHWQRRIKAESGNKTARWQSHRVEALAERLWHVQIECSPAVDLLKRFEKEKNVVIYCDPPYRTADTKPYHINQQDTDIITETLILQCGQIAISGYNDEWDHLDWQRHEMKTFRPARPSETKSVATTEVLWTNYDAHKLNIIDHGLFAPAQ